MGHVTVKVKVNRTGQHQQHMLMQGWLACKASGHISQHPINRLCQVPRLP